MNGLAQFPAKNGTAGVHSAANATQTQQASPAPAKYENPKTDEKIENKTQQSTSLEPFPKRNHGGRVTLPSGNAPRYNQAESFIGTRRFSAVSAESLIKNRDCRRKGFSSKSISTTTMTIPVHEKTEEETETIKSIIKKVSFLSFLKQEQVTALVNAMFEKRYKPGDIIIKQGDIGNNFYILQEGIVDIFKKGENDTEEKKITELGVGSYFGELALMSGGRRAATVSAQTECRCWAIDQTTYLYLLRDVHHQRRQKCREIIAKVPLLADLPDYEALLVAESLVVEEYPADTVLVKQNEKGDKFYLIIDGDANVLINGNKVNELHTGSFFGELALIYDVARAATVISSSAIKVAFITGEMFRKVLEKCSSTFKAKEMSYHQKQN
jgi:cAMP-dependent protein kinase regulator